MKQIALCEAKAKLSELVDEVRRSHGSIVTQRRSNPVAVVVEMDRFRRLHVLQALHVGGRRQHGRWRRVGPS